MIIIFWLSFDSFLDMKIFTWRSSTAWSFSCCIFATWQRFYTLFENYTEIGVCPWTLSHLCLQCLLVSLFVSNQLRDGLLIFFKDLIAWRIYCYLNETSVSGKPVSSGLHFLSWPADLLSTFQSPWRGNEGVIWWHFSFGKLNQVTIKVN